MTTASTRSARLVRRTIRSATRRGLQFVRRASASGLIVASIFATGEASAQTVTTPPPINGQVSNAGITFNGGPASTVVMNADGRLTLRGPAAGPGFVQVTSRHYDHPSGNPPETAFVTSAAVDALIASSNSVLMVTAPLTRPIEFPSTDGQPYTSIGVTLPPVAGDDDDTFFSTWTGRLNVPTAGSYSFFTESDDGSMVWIDLNDDGDFADAGETVVNNNRYQGMAERGTNQPGNPPLISDPPPTLAARLYDVKIANYEGGGGVGLIARWTPPGGAKEVIPLGLVPADVPNPTVSTAVTVNDNATIDIDFTANANFGPLTFAGAGKTLNKQGGGNIGFTSTTLNGATTLNVAAGQLAGGTLNAPAGSSLTKTGGGELRFPTSAGASVTSNPAVNVNGGTLSVGVTGSTTSVGSGAISLNGGTLALGNDPNVPTRGGLFGTTGQFYLDDNIFDPLVSQDSANTFGWSGLDSKALLDTKLAPRTPIATRDVNLPINFPRGNGDPATGGTDDIGGAVFNVDGANLGVPLNGSGLADGDWAARFTGKLNVTTAGPTPFTLLSNDGAVMFIDLNLGAGQDWQKVVDNNRFSTTGGNAFQGHVSGSPNALDNAFNPHPAGPAIPQPAVPTLAVGQYDYIVGTFNKNDNEYGIELFWTPPGGSRELVPSATSGPINLTNAVTVSGNSGLQLNAPTTLPNIVINDGGVLNVTGESLTLTQTTINGVGRIDMNANVNLGTIVPGTAGAPFTFIKGGSATIDAATLGVSGLSSAHGIGVAGGRLIVAGAKGTTAPSIGSAKIVMGGGTFVAESGIVETPGAANTLTEYWYHTLGNISELSIEPPDRAGGLLRRVPTGSQPLTQSLVQFGDDAASGDTVDIGARWGRLDQVAALWFGEMTFSGGSAHGNNYTFASKSDDGSAWWVDLDNDGRFEGGGRRSNDGTVPNEMVLDNNDYQGDEAVSSLRTIPDGTYRVALGWYEGGGGATSSFKWQRGDGTFPFSNEGAYDGSATLLPVDPTVSTVASSRGRSFDVNAETGNASFQGNAVEVIGGTTTIEASGATRFGAMTFTNTATVNATGSKTTIASATTTNGVGTLSSALGPGSLTLGDVGASAGATTLLGGDRTSVTGSFTGAGTVGVGVNGTVDFTKSGAASSGSPSLSIARGGTMNFSPGAGNTFGGSAVTAIDHSGTLRAGNGITDLSGAVVTTTVIPGTIISQGLSNVVGDFYNTTTVPLPAMPNSTNTFGWAALDTKGQFDAELAGKTPLATRTINFPVNFPDPNGSLADGGENDRGDEIFNVQGANLGVPLRGDQDFVVRFAGKMNVTSPGATGFGLSANDGGVVFLDLDQGAGENWVKVADHNRFTVAGGGAFSEHGSAGQGDPGTPAIPQPARPNLSVGTYDFAVGFFNTREPNDDTPEAGIELYWVPAGGSRSIIPVGDVILPTVVQVDSGATLRLGAVRAVSNVNIDATGRLELHGGASKINASALSIAGTPTAPTATLDVTDSALVLDFPAGGPNPSADTWSRIIAGRGSTDLLGTWTGQGITSSSAAADNSTLSVGWANNADLPLGPYTTFRGQPVDETAVIIRGTRIGDANLDGVVNDDDVTIVGATFGMTSGAVWGLGDFTYDGAVNDDDVTLLGALYDPTATPIGGAPLALEGAVAAVPEPATWLMLTLGGLGAGLFGWRRRKSQQA